MGRWHAYYARRSGAEVVAVVDPAAASAKAVAAGAPTFSELGAALSEARPQVVHVCSPLATHAALARQAVDAGVHALVEKPLTAGAAETAALLETARARGVHVCPVHQFAFQRGIASAAQALPRLGEPLHVTFSILSAGAAGGGAEARDEILADILPHPLSVLQALWPGNALDARDWSAQRPRAGEMHVRGRSGGAVVSAWISMSARPTRCDLEIACSEGSVSVNFFHGYAVVRHGSASRAEKIGAPFRTAAGTLAHAAVNLAGRAWRRELAYPGLESLVGAFYAAARGGPPPVTAAQALAVAELREHLLREAPPGALAG